MGWCKPSYKKKGSYEGGSHIVCHWGGAVVANPEAAGQAVEVAK